MKNDRVCLKPVNCTEAECCWCSKQLEDGFKTIFVEDNEFNYSRSEYESEFFCNKKCAAKYFETKITLVVVEGE
jgi:ribosomal protein L24E